MSKSRVPDCDFDFQSRLLNMEIFNYDPWLKKLELNWVSDQTWATNTYVPATHARMHHSIRVGSDPLLVVTSADKYSFNISFSNHSARYTSIRWDAKISKTGMESQT